MTHTNLPDLPVEIRALRVISEKDAACFIGISQPQLRRMRRAGQAPRHVRLGRRRLGYRLADLIAWLEVRAAPEA